MAVCREPSAHQGKHGKLTSVLLPAAAAAGPQVDVAFLVVGDPFGATTHTGAHMLPSEAEQSTPVALVRPVTSCHICFHRRHPSFPLCLTPLSPAAAIFCIPHCRRPADLQIRARERGIPVSVIHNASVMNAVGACGLQLYRFGEAVSICFFTDTWRPDSFYDR
jgi:hypothetical protein